MQRPRCVWLGASNLTRGLLALGDAARGRHGGPVEVFAALGRGRSYGLRSGFLGRTLPGIDGCGLWPALATAPPAETHGLVMDVGNDLFYGQAPAQILAWVDRALARLRPHCRELHVVGLPVARLLRWPAWQFYAFRNVLVPGSRLTLEAGRAGAVALDEGLQALAQRHGARFLPVDPAWYGFDPIHVRRRHWPTAAGVLLASSARGRPPLDRIGGRLLTELAAPAHGWWLGRERRRPQPARTFADGTSLSLW